MDWAQKRKFKYMTIVVIFFTIIGFLIFRKITNVTPTCFDNKKNGGETNIDCGGSCLQYCPNELIDPKVRWVRSFEISPGIVHSVAYIEHSYPMASAREVKYQFKLYDENSVLIVEKEGSTYLGPMGRTAIVETLIPTGNIKIAVTRFSFIPPVPWEKSDISFSQVVIKTDRTVFEKYTKGSRVTAIIENKSRYSFTNSEIVAILYDDKDNAITSSKILLPYLEGESSETVYFTWPFAIEPKDVRTIEIIPRFNPFTGIQI